VRSTVITLLVALLASTSCASSPQYVKIKRDIAIPADDLFHDPGDRGWSGRVDSGSECIETSRKGSIVYVRCPIVLDEDLVERIERE